MGMTQTQKILAAHAGLAEVKAGQLINAKLDIVLGNDITTPVAINEFEKAGFDGVFDKEHIAIVLDHFVPNKDIKSATQSKQCREFANKYDILNFYDVGQMGIEHHRYGGRHGHRHGMVQGAGCHPVRPDRNAAPAGVRQGPHPPHHR